MQILREHFRTYPAMRPTDVIKLLYQRAFGGEHIAPDEERVRTYLEKEYAAVQRTADGVRVEPIGGGTARLYLNGVPRTSIGTVARLFVRGAARHHKDTAALDAALDRVSALAQSGETPFSAEAWTETLAAWRAAGCPSVHHSEEYRAAYAPAYRVLPASFVPYLPLFFAIDARLAAGARLTVAIDGMCGSGKTTLAQLLRDVYGASVVRMDDFFLPPSLRTEARLCEAGGNVHYERFAAEVAPHLGTGEAFSYRAFDCGKMDFGDMAEVPLNPLTVVEGSYSLHPKAEARYDLTAYVCCAAETQLVRLRARCANESLFARFVREWIPMETAYERAFSVRDGADFVIDTTENGEGEEK